MARPGSLSQRIAITALTGILIYLTVPSFGNDDGGDLGQLVSVPCMPAATDSACGCWEKDGGAVLFRCTGKTSLTSVPLPLPLNTTDV